MAKHTRQNTRFEMQASEEWFHIIDEWRKDKRGISRAEAIRSSAIVGIALSPLLGDILEMSSRAQDDSGASERIFSAIKGLL